MGGMHYWDVLAAPTYQPHIYTPGPAWHRSWHQMRQLLFFWTQVVVLHIATVKGRIPLKQELQSQGYRYGPTACGGISDFPSSPARML